MLLRPKRLRAALLTVILTAAVAGCGRGKDGPPQGPGAMPVTVVTLRAEPVTLVRELPGRTSAYLVAEVRPQVSGIVKARLFTEGASVKAGQALYQLDDATYRADYGVAKAALARAEATLEAARLRAKRTGELVKTGVVSAQDNDNAVAALGQAEADVEASRAALESARVVLSYARIASPISGRIGKSAVTEGALVKAEQDAPLATVQQLDPVYVDVTQSSAELLQLKRELAAGRLEEHASLPVTIVLEDGTRYEHEGTLEFSDVSVDPGTGSYLLRIKVPNPDLTLLPGMYVRALVGNGVRPQGLLVPQQGIARDPQGNATALVVGKDGKVEARMVQATRTVGDKWLVDGGLAAGDRVIVEGLQKVRPGMPVAATEATPSAAASGSPAPGAAAGGTPAAAPQK
jgi:membrane fusion protein (multidrug efflux system)